MSRFRNSYAAYFCMYFFYYLSWALSAALISVYLTGKGFSATEVSLTVSGAFLASMVTQPLIGSLNDRYNMKKVSSFMFVLAIIGAIFFILSDNLIMIIITYSFMMIMVNGTNPVMEKIATGSPFRYGSIRIWGTVGYAAGTQFAGLIYEWISPQAVFIAFILTMVLCIFGFINTDPVVKAEHKENTAKNGGKRLFANKKYVFYLLPMFFEAGAAAAGNTYIPTMFTNEGLSASMTSTILSVAVLFEAPLVIFSYKFMDKLSNKTLLVIIFSMYTAAYASYAFHAPLIIEIIMTFLTKHMMGMLLIMTNLKIVHTIVDVRQEMTALAFVKTVQNFASILYNNVSGRMIDLTGYSLMWSFNFGSLLVALVLVLLFKVPKGTEDKLFS